jgi:hypothetical protein
VQFEAIVDRNKDRHGDKRKVRMLSGIPVVSCKLEWGCDSEFGGHEGTYVPSSPNYVLGRNVGSASHGASTEPEVMLDWSYINSTIAARYYMHLSTKMLPWSKTGTAFRRSLRSNRSKVPEAWSDGN